MKKKEELKESVIEELPEIDMTALMNEFSKDSNSNVDTYEIESVEEEVYTIDFNSSTVGLKEDMGKIKDETEKISAPSFYEDVMIRSVLKKELAKMQTHLESMKKLEDEIFKSTPFGRYNFENSNSIILSKEIRILESYIYSREMITINSIKEDKVQRTVKRRMLEASDVLLELL